MAIISLVVVKFGLCVRFVRCRQYSNKFRQLLALNASICQNTHYQIVKKSKHFLYLPLSPHFASMQIKSTVVLNISEIHNDCAYIELQTCA